MRREATSNPAEKAATRDLLERYLDPNDRALLILRYLHGFDSQELDSQELSGVFRMTPEVVRQRLSRLRHRLRLTADQTTIKPHDLLGDLLHKYEPAAA